MRYNFILIVVGLFILSTSCKKNDQLILVNEVLYYYSTDGNNFKPVGAVKNPVPEDRPGTFITTFKKEFNHVEARYIKVVAKNKGICPDWHPGVGYPSWIFCDEVIVL